MEKSPFSIAIEKGDFPSIKGYDHLHVGDLSVSNEGITVKLEVNTL